MFGQRRLLTWSLEASMAGQSSDNALEEYGKARKVFVVEPDRFSATGLIHSPRLRDRFKTHFEPSAQFEVDAAAGDFPDRSVIEACLIPGHGDDRSPVSRAVGHGVVFSGVDPPSSILVGHGSTCCTGQGAT
jgi:phospholipase C